MARPAAIALALAIKLRRVTFGARDEKSPVIVPPSGSRALIAFAHPRGMCEESAK